MENNELLKDLNSVIEKSLPAQVGKVLKNTLEQGIKDAEAVIALNKQILSLKDTIREKESIIETYKTNDIRNSTLEAREKEVSKKETNAKIAELEVLLKAEQDKSEFAKAMGLGLVRNTEYRRSLMDMKSGPDGRDQYGNHTYSTHSQNSTETTEAK